MIAGSIDRGYKRIRFGSERIRLFNHHIVWFIFNNEWPNLMVDHINGDGLDNRIENLRLATNQQNQFNSDKARGYSFVKRVNKWRSRVMIDGKHIDLGYHSSESEAKIAAKEGRKKYFGEYYRTS